MLIKNGKNFLTKFFCFIRQLMARPWQHMNLGILKFLANNTQVVTPVNRFIQIPLNHHRGKFYPSCLLKLQ